MRATILVSFWLVPLLIGGCTATGGGSNETLPADAVASPADSSAPPDSSREVDLAAPADLALTTPPDLAPPELPGRLRALPGTTDVFLNPERGFYRYVDIPVETDLARIRTGNPPASLVFSYVRLDAYRNAPIARVLLDAMERGLEAARKAGVKVILRFAYNEGPYPNSQPDAPRAQVLAHIAQLAPLLKKHAPVIALVQAGFIGAWGEWHTSTNKLDNPNDMRAIAEALIDALPADRFTQIRYPLAKMALWGAAPLEEKDAFMAAYRARAGHHNDCYLSSADDVGTYWIDTVKYPPRQYPYKPADLERFVEADTKYTPFGGETCALYPAKQDCAAAISAMERHHLSYLNHDYHPNVIKHWLAQGCHVELQRRMGYRLRVVDAELPDRAPPGGRFRLRARLQNDGFAAPFNLRRAFLVIEGPRRIELPVPIDVWRILGGTGATIDMRVELPDPLAPGRYRVALWLPDAAPDLRARPEYAIRLANAGAWDAATGQNVIAELEVGPVM